VTWPSSHVGPFPQHSESLPTRRGASADGTQIVACLESAPRDGHRAMTDTDPGTPGQADRYRETASAVRALIPLMQQPELREQLRLLALEYDRLAHGIEGLSESLRTPPDRRSGPDS
jgi:hypothetical protein